MTLPTRENLTLAQTFMLMASTFPSEPMQVAWGLWSMLWGIMVMLPRNTAFSGVEHPYGWMQSIPSYVWGILWLLKGAPHIWGALRVLQVRVSKDGEERELANAYTVCALTSLLDLIVNCMMAVTFLLTKGILNPVWLWYAFYATTCFWIYSRIVTDDRG